MSVEENKAIAHRMIEESNKYNSDAIDEIFATNFINHNPSFGTTPDREGYKQYIAMLLGAFPDIQLVPEDIIAEGDKVVMRLRGQGTHKGELMGIPPAGKQINISTIGIVRIENGKVAERWNISDQLSMMQQLGFSIVPPTR